MIPHGSILDALHSIDDIKQLSEEKLYHLADECRERIISVVSKTGGHLASNLGVVELTIALHRIFSSPRDKIVWDVGHQCYTHKLLTGRGDRFASLRQKGGLSGFPKRCESEHDIVETGHSSTSISAGLGVLVGQELQSIPGKVIAVIGDGALSAGIALEALNNVGHLKKDLVVVLNDNNMSISPNVGALSSYFSRLTATHFYQDIRKKIDTTVKGIPYLGGELLTLISRIKKSIKAFFFKENIFSDLGFEYVGPIDGHNIPLLLSVFKNVKQLKKPIVVHVVTKKGKGYEHAEGDPTLYHGVSPFSVVDGKIEKKSALTYTEAFSEHLLKEAEKNDNIVAITAAMTKGTGLSLFEERFPNRFFDVGITEQHAVTFAAGLSLSGMRPVVALYSTFLQRAVDQIIHDVALPNLPVVFAIDRAGLVGNDGDTHQGAFDTALLRSIPNLTITAPSSQEEMALLMKYASTTSGPVVLRYPRDVCPSLPETDVPITVGRGVMVKHNRADTLLVGVGSTVEVLLKAETVLSRHNIPADVWNMRFIKPVDEEYMIDLFSRYRFIYCLEESSRLGGLGEYLMTIVGSYKLQADYRYHGIPDSFVAHAKRSELLNDYGFTGERVAAEVMHGLTSSDKLHLVNHRAAES